jgi:hypothetical protein
MREQKSTNQVPSSDQERFGGHHSLARDAKPIALRLMALPGNCLDGMEEIEVPEPCETVEKATGNRWNFLGAGLGGGSFCSLVWLLYGLLLPLISHAPLNAGEGFC